MTSLKDLKIHYQTEDVWAFPEDYAFLFDHVKKGDKTATSSYLANYQQPGKVLPVEGAYTILLDDLDQPSQALLMVWSEIRIFPFNDLAADLPAAEMMDRQTWIDIHLRDFVQSARKLGREFHETDQVLAKFFQVSQIVALEAT